MYITLGIYKEDERVRVIDKNDTLKEGRIIRITPQTSKLKGGNYCLITVLPDDKSELVVVQYGKKISKID